MRAVPPSSTRLPIVLTACAWIAGCAAAGIFHETPGGPGSARTPTGESIAPQSAMEAISVGTSTKTDVASALGKAIVVAFDSGYEVWVYRWPGADRTTRTATELVLLFEPSGRVAKARLKPGYPPRR